MLLWCDNLISSSLEIYVPKNMRARVSCVISLGISRHLGYPSHICLDLRSSVKMKRCMGTSRIVTVLKRLIRYECLNMLWFLHFCFFIVKPTELEHQRIFPACSFGDTRPLRVLWIFCHAFIMGAGCSGAELQGAPLKRVTVTSPHFLIWPPRCRVHYDLHLLFCFFSLVSLCLYNESQWEPTFYYISFLWFWEEKKVTNTFILL